MEQIRVARQRQEQQEQLEEDETLAVQDSTTTITTSTTSREQEDVEVVLDGQQDLMRKMMNQMTMRQDSQSDSGSRDWVDADPVTGGFSHLQKQSSSSSLSTSPLSIHMVNVGPKAVTDRRAVAESRVVFPSNVWKALTTTTTTTTKSEGEANVQDLVGPKGPILTTAQLAGIMAAK